MVIGHGGGRQFIESGVNGPGLDIKMDRRGTLRLRSELMIIGSVDWLKKAGWFSGRARGAGGGGYVTSPPQFRSRHLLHCVFRDHHALHWLNRFHSELSE